MAEAKVSLYAAINTLVEERLKQVRASGETVNLPEWASQMAESLADLILFGCPPEEQPKLIAWTFEQLAHFIRKKKEDGLDSQVH